MKHVLRAVRGSPSLMKLAIFVDQVFWRDGPVLSTDESYILFLASFAEVVEEVVLLGRLAPERGRQAYVLEHPNVRLCGLPYYPSIYAIWPTLPRLVAAVRQTIRRHARDWDAVWICGPNPLGQLIARECI